MHNTIEGLSTQCQRAAEKMKDLEVMNNTTLHQIMVATRTHSTALIGLLTAGEGEGRTNLREGNGA